MNDNPGPHAAWCGVCAEWRFVWRLRPRGDRASDGYVRICGVCGKNKGSIKRGEPSCNQIISSAASSPAS